MTSVEVSEIERNFTEVLDRVKKGEQVVVTENGVAIAQIAPTPARPNETDDEKLARLERAGIIRRGRGRIPQWLIDEPPIKLPEGVSVLEALLEERRTAKW